MAEFVSYWRCDTDGETWSISVEPVLIDPDSEETTPLRGDVDLVWQLPAPCPICGGAMRRVVSLADLRSFDEIGAVILQGAEREARRDPACIERWSECESGAYDPRCCRFPKSCSCSSLPDAPA